MGNEIVEDMKPIAISRAVRELGKMLSSPVKELKEIQYDKTMAVMDPVNVMMVIAVSEQAMKVLSHFCEDNYYENLVRVPDLKYKEAKEVQKAKYSTNYLSWIIKFLDWTSSEGGTRIEMKQDYPVTMYNEHFKVILAPRVD